MDKQLVIPGLEGLEKASDNVTKKRMTYEEQIKALQGRLLSLELEVTLLRILLEKDKDHA
jgi:hypothetical protein